MHSSIMGEGSSWFTEVSREKHVLARIAFLCSILSGINLKALIRFTPECKPTVGALQTLMKAKASLRLIGACLLVFRQAYAKKAITAAKIVALRCARARRSLRYVDLKSIKASWERVARKHGKKHAKKVVSRTRAFTGATWIDALLKKWDITKFNAAADCLGELVLRKSPSVDFHKAAAAVSELPLLGISYGGKHVVRSAYVVRTLISNQTMLAITDQDWMYNRDMSNTTTKGFDALSVQE